MHLKKNKKKKQTTSSFNYALKPFTTEFCQIKEAYICILSIHQFGS